MEVTIYGTSVCPNCDKVKTFLTNKKVPFAYSAVGSDISKEQLEEVANRSVRAVPVIMVDGNERTFDQLRQMM